MELQCAYVCTTPAITPTMVFVLMSVRLPMHGVWPASVPNPHAQHQHHSTECSKHWSQESETIYYHKPHTVCGSTQVAVLCEAGGEREEREDGEGGRRGREEGEGGGRGRKGEH